MWTAGREGAVFGLTTAFSAGAGLGSGGSDGSAARA